MKKKIKKYLTGGRVNSFVGNPAEIFAQEALNRDKAQAMGATGLTQGLDALAGVLAAGGSQMISGAFAGGMTKGEFKAPLKDALEFIDGGSIFKFGGPVGSQQVEVQGDEVAETPNGQLIDYAGGPSHEQGGIQQNLPVGTEIFSNEIKVSGNTMADRKLLREKREAKYKKLLSKDPFDKVLSKTLKRIQQINEKEEASDMALQEQISKMMQPQEQAPQAKFGMTVGDAIGIGSQLYGAFQPRKDTLADRATDTIMQNPYENYGVDAMAGFETQKGVINHSFDEQNLAIDADAQAAMSANRGAARGINTTRALDFAAQAQINKAKTAVAGQTDQMLSQLFGQETQANLQIDQAKIQGEEMARAENQANLTAFNSNMSQGKQDIVKGLQQGAKMFNDIKERDIKYGLLKTGMFWINPTTGQVEANPAYLEGLQKEAEAKALEQSGEAFLKRSTLPTFKSFNFNTSVKAKK